MIKIIKNVQDVFGASIAVGHNEFGDLVLDGKTFTPHQADELINAIGEALSAGYAEMPTPHGLIMENKRTASHDEGTSYCTTLPEHDHT